jgi:hypothetical protein
MTLKKNKIEKYLKNHLNTLKDENGAKYKIIE